ncbi:MAG: diguanylate cyclase [Microbacterium sp.]
MRPQPHIDPTTTEILRLEQCVREPIRTPGRIQSHGILFAYNTAAALIDVVSENAAGWLGRSIDELGSPTLEWCVVSGAHADPVRVDIDGESYDAIVHQSPGRVIVELEDAVDRSDFPSTSVTGAIRRLAQVDSAEELRQRAAEEVREITGFDRVMVYRFFDDGHGEVAGEAADESMDPYQGLRFPASDIPQQARSLYITKLSRVIAATDDPGFALLGIDAEAEPLDLSEAELRAVSPHHLEFMRNMGQESTVSFSLVHDGRLVGMITCAHRTKRRIPILLRRALEMFASQLSTQMAALESIAQLRQELAARERRRALLARIPTSADPLEALFASSESLLETLAADGAIIRIDGISKGIGTVPHVERAALLDSVGIEPFATESVRTTHPGVATLMPEIAGLLVAPVGRYGVMLLFREEATQVIRWLGDQGEQNRDTPLSPRRSFSAWSQSVSGRALPWGSTAEQAQTLGRELAEALDRRAESQLAELALVDSLTGLRNRRSLLEVLEELVAERRGGSVMFLDLDRFKSLNDRFGHEVGDIVLRTVAARLTAVSRATDTIARLGGDEFVMLCPDVPPEDQTLVAERIVHEVAQPIELLPGEDITVTVSCGIVAIEQGATPRSILQQADAAMYRAKHGGRNRMSA